MNRRPVVSVIGDARLDDPSRVVEARALGAALVDAGFRVVTGGLGGVMEEVSYGARHADGWTEGSVVGIIPSYRASEANSWCDVVIPTGLQLARNVLVVSTGDVVVAYGGESGTLSEMALAWQLGKPIIALGEVGWAGRMAGTAIDGRTSTVVEACRTVDEVVARCRVLLGSAPSPGEVGDGWRKRGT